MNPSRRPWMVWAPFLGINMVCLHVAMPALGAKSIGKIGGTAG